MTCRRDRWNWSGIERYFFLVLRSATVEQHLELLLQLGDYRRRHDRADHRADGVAVVVVATLAKDLQRREPGDGTVDPGGEGDGVTVDLVEHSGEQAVHL